MSGKYLLELHNISLSNMNMKNIFLPYNKVLRSGRFQLELHSSWQAG